MSLDYIIINTGAKFFDMCAYIVKTELPGNYLYEYVSNSSVTHATVKTEKWEQAKTLLESKGFKVVNW